MKQPITQAVAIVSGPQAGPLSGKPT